MKIYTRTGDSGETALFGGARVPKDHLRLEAYGTLDELNSVLGVLRLHASEAAAAGPLLTRIQGDLFVLGALLATPPEAKDRLEARLTRGTWPLPAMEADIDRLTALAPPLTSFVLPGGATAAAHAHWARTVCRRSERAAVALARQEHVEAEVLTYLNRLGDWLFALARAENAVAGCPDAAWEPPQA